MHLIKYLLMWLSPWWHRATKCHHLTKRTGMITAFGETIESKKEGEIEYCWDCLSKMSIQCAWCGKPIHIGNPITLYSPKDSFVVPAYSVVYSKEPLQLVGCLRWKCARTGADLAGYWVPGENGKGMVYIQPILDQVPFLARSTDTAVSTDPSKTVKMTALNVEPPKN